MKNNILNIFFAVGLMTGFVACNDDDYSNITPEGNPQVSASVSGNALMGSAITFSADCSDNSGTALSTLDAELLFSGESVDRATIRTQNAGSYDVTLNVPYLRYIPDGDATIRLTLCNVTTKKAVSETTVKIERPHFSDLNFVASDGKKYPMTEGSDHNYSAKYNAVDNVFKGHFETADGNFVFGNSGAEISLGATGNIDFQTAETGEITVTFNTRDYTFAPFDEVAITPLMFTADDNSITRAMTQGKQYAISGIVDGEWFIMSDYFEDDGDGTVTFLGVDGTYTINALTDNKFLQVYPSEDGNPATLQDDGSGALWIIGEGIGLPSVKSNEVGWTTEKAISLAQIEPKVYQITLVAGKTVSADKINFKFFGQMGWGIELTGDKITSTSDIVLVGDGENGHDNGNLYIADGKSLDINGIYTFTVNLTGGTDNAVLSVEKIGDAEAPETLPISLNGTPMQSTDGDEYTLTLDLTKGNNLTITGIDNLADYWVHPDYFNGTPDNLTLAAVDGNYTVTVNTADKTITALNSQNTLTDDGHGTIWILGFGAGSPSLAQEAGWNPGKGVALPEVDDHIFRLTAVAGDEGDATLGTRLRISGWGLNFFFQDGWGGEFSGDNNLTLSGTAATLLNYDNGNINIDGNTLETGATYVLTIDLTAGVDKGVLTLEKQ